MYVYTIHAHDIKEKNQILYMYANNMVEKDFDLDPRLHLYRLVLVI